MRIIAKSLVLFGFTCLSSANAAHITITAQGTTVDIECSEITVDGVLPGEHWLSGTAVCQKVCEAIDGIEDWECAFHGEYLIIDGPPNSDLGALFKSGSLEIDWDDITKPLPNQTTTTTRR